MGPPGVALTGSVLPQPPLVLVLRLQDLQLPFQLAFQLAFSPWLLPLWSPRAVPLALLVPLALPLPALLALPQPRTAALRRRVPRWAPLLALASPAWRVCSPQKEQVWVPAHLRLGGCGHWGNQDGVLAQSMMQGMEVSGFCLDYPSLLDLGTAWAGPLE